MFNITAIEILAVSPLPGGADSLGIASLFFIKNGGERMNKKQRWYYHLRGQVYAYGPTSPMTKMELLEFLRNAWGNGRVPYGTQYWKAVPWW